MTELSLFSATKRRLRRGRNACYKYDREINTMEGDLFNPKHKLAQE